MSVQQFNIGVMGVGHRPMFLTRLLVRDTRFKVVAVYDRYKPALDQLEDKLQLEGSNPCCTTDLNVFFCQDLNLVIIGSTNSEHYDHIRRAMDKGLNIFCEKPIVTNLDDCRYLLEHVDSYQNLFGTGFVLRYSPFYKKVYDLIQEGVIGDICNIRAYDGLHLGHGALINTNWRRFKSESGGHIVEKGVHLIDLLSWYVGGKDVTKLNAFGSNMFWDRNHEHLRDELKTKYSNEKLFEAYAIYEDLDPFTSEKDIEDTFSCNLQYEGGAVANLTMVSYCPDSRREFNFVGTLGTIDAVWSKGVAKISVTTRGMGRKKDKGTPSETITFEFDDMGCHGGGDEYIVSNLISAVANGTPMDTPVKFALESTRIGLLLERSLNHNEKNEKNEKNE